MGCSIDGLEPKEVFKWFYEISQIPRGSGNEQGISDFLVKFAKDKKLEVYQDSALNVIIKKSGTKGYENSKSVIIQGHMDMVCEKSAESNHDFLKDPIELVVKGDELWANNTTLGGDDGIAVAYALALLDSDDIPHPPVEVVITTNEETNMGGAWALSNEHLDSSIILNVDSEEEGIFLVSCSGGVNLTVDFKIERESIKNTLLQIDISGLTGGHSGIQIVDQRANAIKLLGRLLYGISSETHCNIVQISGGSKPNAISNIASVIVSVQDVSVAEKVVKTLTDNFKSEFRSTDPDLCVDIQKATSNSQDMYTDSCTKSIIDFFMIVPDGVQRMSMDIKGLVETSLNNGVLIEESKDSLKLYILPRSSNKGALDYLSDRVKIAANLVGAKFLKDSEYPAWEYVVDSAIRDIAIKTWKDLYGKDPEVSAVHAGLECGVFNRIIPKMDAISFGPDLFDVHTANEHLNIPSTQRVWKFFKAFLANLK